MNIFCVAGEHGGPRCKELPPDWRLVKARYDVDRNLWCYDPNSKYSVNVCGQHKIEGEPNEPS